MSEDRKKASQGEIQKLLDTGVIREVQYPEWLANVVMVPKKNSKWRMCIDFTTLNKFCPKDDYPLPRIDPLEDAAAGSEMLSMLDCFSATKRGYFAKLTYPCRIPYRIQILRGYGRIHIRDVSNKNMIFK